METRIVRRVANCIDFAVSLLAAVFLATIMIFAAEVKLGPEMEITPSQRIAVVTVGMALAILLLVGAVLRAVHHIRRSTERRYLVFETPGGSVSVRAASVEHAINRAAVHMDEVADASVVLVLPKGAHIPSEARVRCRLFDRPNLLAIQDKVRAAVSDRYLEMFPGQEPLPVQVSVERIVFEIPEPKAAPAPSAAGDAEGQDSEQQPFRPQYPVGD